MGRTGAFTPPAEYIERPAAFRCIPDLESC